MGGLESMKSNSRDGEGNPIDSVEACLEVLGFLAFTLEKQVGLADA